MFWVLGYIFSLILVFATSAYFFEKRRQGNALTNRNWFDLCIVCTLPFFSSSAFVIKVLEVQDEMKIILITLGGLVCLAVIALANKYGYLSRR